MLWVAFIHKTKTTRSKLKRYKTDIYFSLLPPKKLTTMRTITLILIAFSLLPSFVWANCNLVTKFSYKTKGLYVTFNNQSVGNYSEVIWSFGDGNVSTEKNPLHKYTNGGEYKFSVTLKTNEGCSSIYQGKVYVFATSIETKNEQQIINPESIKSYPEPFINSTNIDFFIEKSTYIVIDICNTDGVVVRNLHSALLAAGKQSVAFNAENLPPAVYFVHLKSDNQNLVRKIVVQ